MPNVTTNWKWCMYGGPKGGNGHQVLGEKMSTMVTRTKVIRICEDCKARRQAEKKNARNS
jgi:hypothetical protein